ncbi:MAG: response regulator transcription factor [Gammaproteobacteria bacterium]|nr:response regulator transcription factor [Gammaproteobacteria bacterium]
MNQSPLKIVLADDHTFILDGIRLLLENYSNFHVVGEAKNYAEVQGILKTEKPDYLILDYQMPGGDGMSGLLSVRRRHPEVKIILLTGVHSGAVLTSVLDAGVKGIILKEGEGDELLRAIKHIEEGEYYVSDAARDMLTRTPHTQLTRREQQVLSMIAEGLNNNEMAEKLKLSPKTIDNHRSNMMRKLGLHNAAEVVSYAIREGYKP